MSWQIHTQTDKDTVTDAAQVIEKLQFKRITRKYDTFRSSFKLTSLQNNIAEVNNNIAG